jgi:lysophospholipase L1-like esterase
MHSFPTMLLSILVVVAPLSGGQAKNPEAVLVTEEGTTAPLIVEKNAPPHTIEAVEELARLMEKISGYRPEILNVPPDPLPASTIWVGPHPGLAKAMPGVDFQLTQPEETLFVSQDGHVAILGMDKMVGEEQIMSGTANAVYSFAQEVLGVRWLWPGELGEDIVASKTIRVPPQTVRFTPVFLQRRLFYRTDQPSEKTWTVRQRLAYDYLQAPAGHAFDDWWEKYSKTHPEYFALQPDGTRSGFPEPRYAKVCEGEPGVARQWLENVAEQLKKNPTQRIFNAAQNDGSNAGICVDPRSTAMDEPGAPLQNYSWKDKSTTDVAMSDRMVRFANKLGELLEKRYPDEDLKVLAMPYGPSKPAPMKAVPRDNVVISYVGQFPTSGDKWREEEKAQYAAWARTAPFMIFRPNLFYYSGGWHGLPVITPHLVAEDFRFLADHSCRGITVDGTPNHFGTQGLQYYVMAQLMWNPYQDVGALVDDFCLRGFGPAASEVRAYYDLMEQAQLAVLNHPEWFPGMGTIRDPLCEVILPTVYSPELLDKADQKLAEAAKALENAPEVYRQRLDFIQRGQEFTRLMMDTILTMNDVRQSKGRNVAAVEKAVALVKAREEFFREEEVRAKAASRPPVANAHAIRTTWIESRKLQDWLGPVSEEFLQAAAAAKKAGVTVTSDREERKAPPTKEVQLAKPATLRWTGAAGDGSWQNRQNWEALSVANSWVPAPAPPQDGARVEFGDAVARPGPQVLRLSADVELERITVSSSVPINTYKIENRLDLDGGIDADSTRLFALTLTGTSPIIQPAQTRADVDFEVQVHLAHPETHKDFQSEHGAKIRFLKAGPGGKTGPPQASQEAGQPKPEILGNGPVVLFGDSTTAVREGIKVYGDDLIEVFSRNQWTVDILNAGVGGNTTQQARERLVRDVLAHNPSLVVVQFGINDAAVDVWKSPPAVEPRVALSDYRANLEFFVEQIRAKDAAVVLMTPNPMQWTPTLLEKYGKPPYLPENGDGFNVVLKSYAEAVRALAREKKVPLIDVYAAYERFHQETGRPVNTLLLDGMHPNNDGHALVRDLLLSEWMRNPDKPTPNTQP